MTARQRALLLVVSCPGFMVYLDVTVVNVAFPSLQSSFDGASLSGLSWVLSAYSIVFAALLVPGGRLSQTLGSRRVFLTGLAVFTLASVACSAAPSVGVLVGARVLQAVGGALLIPASQAVLMTAFAPERRATVIGLWAAAAAVASAAGPPLGGLVVEGWSWRIVFLVNAPIGVAALIAGLRIIPSDAPRVGPWPDGLSAALVIAGVSALALGLVQGPYWGWSDARVLIAFAATPLLLAALVVRSSATPAPVLDLALMRARGFVVANIAALLTGITFYAVLLGGILFLTDVWEYSVLEAGLAIAPMPVVGALTAPIAGRLTDRTDPRRIAVPGALAFTAGAALLYVRADETADYLATWLPASILLGAGMGFGYTALVSIAALELTPDTFAIGSGMNAMTRQLAAVLGVAILVAVIGTPAQQDAVEAFDRAWLVAALTALAAALSCLLLPVRRSRMTGT